MSFEASAPPPFLPPFGIVPASRPRLCRPKHGLGCRILLRSPRHSTSFDEQQFSRREEEGRGDGGSRRGDRRQGAGGGGWGDVAYHFILDQNGKVYEGRPESVQGRSFTSYSLDNKLLICVLGDFRSIEERKTNLQNALGRELTPEEIEKVEHSISRRGLNMR